MKIKNIWEKNEAVSPVIAVILMVAITVVLAAVLYVWAAGLASTGGSAPPAFSASVVDAADSISATTTNKNLGTLTGSTFAAGSIVAPRAYSSGVAFVLAYSGAAFTPAYIHVNVTYEDEAGISSTAGPVAFANTAGIPIVDYKANLSGSDVGVKKVTAITVTDNVKAAYTLAAGDKIYANTTNYDTICKITADNGKPGDITKLTFYIKIGTTGDWKKLTPDAASPYKVGAVVLDGASTDLSWDVGESVYISETSTLGDIAPDTTNPVYVKVIHEPSSSTIYESKNGVNIL